jgi:hypothetical protein
MGWTNGVLARVSRARRGSWSWTVGVLVAAVTGLTAAAQAASPSFRLIELQTYPGFVQNSVMGGAAGAASGYAQDSSNNYHAMYWGSASSTPVDLHPGGIFNRSFALGAFSIGSSSYQVGVAPGVYDTDLYTEQAIVWQGTAQSAVNISPDLQSEYRATAGSSAPNGGVQIVGARASSSSGSRVAGVWTGNNLASLTFTPLTSNRSLYQLDQATGAASNGVSSEQVGYTDDGFGLDRAMIWTGTAGSAIDVTPAGKLSAKLTSVALSSSGYVQVGIAGGNNFVGGIATVWTGSAAGAKPLGSTSSFTYSEADSTNGLWAVGLGQGAGTGNVEHAMLWTDLTGAGPALDLNSIPLADGHTTPTFSSAVCVDAVGTIYGSATIGGIAYAVEWVPVPEPTMLISCLASSLLLSRRCHRRSTGEISEVLRERKTKPLRPT